MVLLLDRSPDGVRGLDPAELLAGRRVLADFSDGLGRHLVVSGKAGRHRLLVKAPLCRTGHGFVVVPDRWHEVRLAALSAFFRARRFADPSPCLPTRFQRHRFGLMLAVLDRIERADCDPITIRELAETIVYPRIELGRAIEWKSSSWRRQTQRLVAEARAMAGGGYRRLLQGGW